MGRIRIFSRLISRPVPGSAVTSGKLPAATGILLFRRRVMDEHMIREHFQFRSTIATILADRQDHVDVARTALIEARQKVERYVASDPYFRTSFEPYTPATDDPVIVRMADAARQAGVGPMAAVAGAIAWAGVEAMRDAGAAFAVIDNGGDIAMLTDREIRIGIFAGSSPFSGRCAFLIPPTDGILGCCTSSATVGPSISFGVADAVTIFSGNVALADAWATRVCNEVGVDDAGVFHSLEGSGVQGAFVIIGEWTARWGMLPDLVRAHVDERLISSGDPF